MANRHPLFAQGQRPTPAGPGLLDFARDIYGPKLGLLGNMAERGQNEMGLLNRARSGDKAASDQWLAQAMQSPFMGFGVGNIKAYHGSPHAFSKFSTKHIGKGEGAQAYGHGLYFAENPKVAQTYRMSGDARFNRMTGGAMTPKQEFAFDLADGGRSEFDIIKAMARKYGTAMDFDEAQSLAKEAVKQRGRLYEVNIKPDPPDFLDWDKPLSPARAKDVVAALGDVRPVKLGSGFYGLTRINPDGTGNIIKGVNESSPAAARASLIATFDGISGADALRTVSGIVGGDDIAAAALRKAGIRGIKYKDAGSRASGEGTNNYVVFDDADVEIKGLLD